MTTGIYQRYLTSPWDVVNDPSVPRDWWVSFVDSFQTEHSHSLVQLFRRLLLVAKPTKKDLWTLRIIAGAHPLVAIQSLSLVLSRGKGVFSGLNKNSVGDSQPLIERSKSPLEGDSKRPRTITVQRFGVEDSPFTHLRAEAVEDHELEYVELTDTDPESFERTRELENALDIVEVLRRPLVLSPDRHFREAIAFLLALLAKPEGKAQRQVMQRLVIRAGGVLAYWVSADPDRARRLLISECDDLPDYVSGAINRMAYYNPGAKKMQWIKENWNDPTMTVRFPPELRVLDEDAPSEQIKLLDNKAVDYEHLYRETCLRPSLVLALEDGILRRLASVGIHPYHKHFVSLVLCLAYNAPHKALRIASNLEEWMRNKDEARRDERIIAFLEGVAMARKTGTA